jgi:hypothetical protein
MVDGPWMVSLSRVLVFEAFLRSLFVGWLHENLMLPIFNPTCQFSRQKLTERPKYSFNQPEPT